VERNAPVVDCFMKEHTKSSGRRPSERRRGPNNEKLGKKKKGPKVEV